jgi:hypothetical protein
MTSNLRLGARLLLGTGLIDAGNVQASSDLDHLAVDRDDPGGLGDQRDGERGQASGRWATEWLSVLCA